MTHISCHFSSLSFTLNYYEDPPSLAYVALGRYTEWWVEELLLIYMEGIFD